MGGRRDAPSSRPCRTSRARAPRRRGPRRSHLAQIQLDQLDAQTEAGASTDSPTPPLRLKRSSRAAWSLRDRKGARVRPRQRARPTGRQGQAKHAPLEILEEAVHLPLALGLRRRRCRRRRRVAELQPARGVSVARAEAAEVGRRDAPHEVRDPRAASTARKRPWSLRRKRVVGQPSCPCAHLESMAGRRRTARSDEASSRLLVAGRRALAFEVGRVLSKDASSLPGRCTRRHRQRAGRATEAAASSGGTHRSSSSCLRLACSRSRSRFDLRWMPCENVCCFSAPSACFCRVVGVVQERTG